jgi:hypothetical protein
VLERAVATGKELPKVVCNDGRSAFTLSCCRTYRVACGIACRNEIQGEQIIEFLEYLNTALRRARSVLDDRIEHLLPGPLR